MKKYTLIIMIGAFFCTPQAKAMETTPQAEAMEKKLTPTNMTSEDAKRLRKAVVDYKKNRSREDAEQIINEYRVKHPNDTLVMAKMNEIRRFKEAEEKKLQESQIQEERSCSICMENLRQIPCKNKHNELICITCLANIKNATNLCPICRGPLQ